MVFPGPNDLDRALTFFWTVLSSFFFLLVPEDDADFRVVFLVGVVNPSASFGGLSGSAGVSAMVIVRGALEFQFPCVCVLFVLCQGQFLSALLDFE